MLYKLYYNNTEIVVSVFVSSHVISRLNVQLSYKPFQSAQVYTDVQPDIIMNN